VLKNPWQDYGFQGWKAPAFHPLGCGGSMLLPCSKKYDVSNGWAMSTIINSKRITIKGIVQGVGFRPHVYRLATDLKLRGWIMNTASGVFIEVEGPLPGIDEFIRLLLEAPPPLALITSCQVEDIATQHFGDFTILESVNQQTREVMVSPDIAICADCQREVLDPQNRRFHYPFINCTNCGPRFTIIQDVPYDRVNTTMAKFPMCRECGAEYRDPLNRRFHAQPNACPRCGPHAILTDRLGESCKDKVIDVLKAGAIVAVKGLGAFHLAVDASNREAVSLLRQRKKRDVKPFAVMARDLEAVKKYCQVTAREEQWLTSRQAPIVVIESKANPAIPGELLHPGLNTLGVMLPYSPLHYILFDEELDLLVMTSANISDEPIITDNIEALSKLKNLADYFLLHNRDIFNPCDDSVMSCTSMGTPNIIRRARGFVPQGIKIEGMKTEPTVLAVGGEMKNTFCLTRGDEAFLSQHWGDLNHYNNYLNFSEGIKRFKNMLAVEPAVIAHDLHPNYQSTRWALQQTHLDLVPVQHHYAHMASVMAENGINGPAIGLICDGTGWGTDGAVWGGEVLIGDYRGFDRVAHLKYMPLPGGDLTSKKPYRMAFIYLYQLMGEKAYPYAERWLPDLTWQERDIMVNRLQQPEPLVTSSCGRLFDAVSSILGICHFNRYEGQAAMELEAMADMKTDGIYPGWIEKSPDGLIMDVSEIWMALLNDLDRGVLLSAISARFHRSLAWLFTETIRRVYERSGIKQVVMSGGVFHNNILLKTMLQSLKKLELEVYIHKQVPAGDGGIALGQAIIASEVTP
jgi:hydrogenase maturation protein HypF